MIEVFLAKWGTEILTALGAIITTSIGYLVARDKDRNQFVLSMVRELNDENQADKDYLTKRLDIVQTQLDDLKIVQIECEKSKGMLEVQVEGLKKEIDFLVASYQNPEAIKIFFSLQKKSKGKYFQHADINEIYKKIIDAPNPN